MATDGRVEKVKNEVNTVLRGILEWSADEQMTKDIADIRGKIEKKRKEAVDLEQQHIKRMKGDVDKMQTQYNETEGQVQKLQSEVEALKAERDDRENVRATSTDIVNLPLGRALAVQAMVFMNFSSVDSYHAFTETHGDVTDERIGKIKNWLESGYVWSEGQDENEFKSEYWTKKLKYTPLDGINECQTWHQIMEAVLAGIYSKPRNACYTFNTTNTTGAQEFEMYRHMRAGNEQRAADVAAELKMYSVTYDNFKHIVESFDKNTYKLDLYALPPQESRGCEVYPMEFALLVVTRAMKMFTNAGMSDQEAFYLMQRIVTTEVTVASTLLVSKIHSTRATPDVVVSDIVVTEEKLPDSHSFQDWKAWILNLPEPMQFDFRKHLQELCGRIFNGNYLTIDESELLGMLATKIDEVLDGEKYYWMKGDSHCPMFDELSKVRGAILEYNVPWSPQLATEQAKSKNKLITTLSTFDLPSALESASKEVTSKKTTFLKAMRFVAPTEDTYTRNKDDINMIASLFKLANHCGQPTTETGDYNTFEADFLTLFAKLKSSDSNLSSATCFKDVATTLAKRDTRLAFASATLSAWAYPMTSTTNQELQSKIRAVFCATQIPVATAATQDLDAVRAETISLMTYLYPDSDSSDSSDMRTNYDALGSTPDYEDYVEFKKTLINTSQTTAWTELKTLPVENGEPGLADIEKYNKKYNDVDKEDAFDTSNKLQALVTGINSLISPPVEHIPSPFAEVRTKGVPKSVVTTFLQVVRTKLKQIADAGVLAAKERERIDNENKKAKDASQKVEEAKRDCEQLLEKKYLNAGHVTDFKEKLRDAKSADDIKTIRENITAAAAKDWFECVKALVVKAAPWASKGSFDACSDIAQVLGIVDAKCPLIKGIVDGASIRATLTGAEHDRAFTVSFEEQLTEIAEQAERLTRHASTTSSKLSQLYLLKQVYDSSIIELDKCKTVDEVDNVYSNYCTIAQQESKNALQKLASPENNFKFTKTLPLVLSDLIQQWYPQQATQAVTRRLHHSRELELKYRMPSSERVDIEEIQRRIREIEAEEPGDDQKLLKADKHFRLAVEYDIYFQRTEEIGLSKQDNNVAENLKNMTNLLLAYIAEASVADSADGKTRRQACEDKLEAYDKLIYANTMLISKTGKGMAVRIAEWQGARTKIEEELNQIESTIRTEDAKEFYNKQRALRTKLMYDEASRKIETCITEVNRQPGANEINRLNGLRALLEGIEIPYDLKDTDLPNKVEDGVKLIDALVDTRTQEIVGVAYTNKEELSKQLASVVAAHASLKDARAETVKAMADRIDALTEINNRIDAYTDATSAPDPPTTTEARDAAIVAFTNALATLTDDDRKLVDTKVVIDKIALFESYRKTDHQIKEYQNALGNVSRYVVSTMTKKQHDKMSWTYQQITRETADVNEYDKARMAPFLGPVKALLLDAAIKLPAEKTELEKYIKLFVDTKYGSILGVDQSLEQAAVNMRRLQELTGDDNKVNTDLYSMKTNALQTLSRQMKKVDRVVISPVSSFEGCKSDCLLGVSNVVTLCNDLSRSEHLTPESQTHYKNLSYQYKVKKEELLSDPRSKALIIEAINEKLAEANKTMEESGTAVNLDLLSELLGTYEVIKELCDSLPEEDKDNKLAEIASASGQATTARDKALKTISDTVETDASGSEEEVTQKLKNVTAVYEANKAYSNITGLLGQLQDKQTMLQNELESRKAGKVMAAQALQTEIAAFITVQVDGVARADEAIARGKALEAKDLADADKAKVTAAIAKLDAAKSALEKIPTDNDCKDVGACQKLKEEFLEARDSLANNVAVADSVRVALRTRIDELTTKISELTEADRQQNEQKENLDDIAAEIAKLKEKDGDVKATIAALDALQSQKAIVDAIKPVPAANEIVHRSVTLSANDAIESQKQRLAELLRNHTNKITELKNVLTKDGLEEYEKRAKEVDAIYEALEGIEGRADVDALKKAVDELKKFYEDTESGSVIVMTSLGDLQSKIAKDTSDDIKKTIQTQKDLIALQILIAAVQTTSDRQNTLKTEVTNDAQAAIDKHVKQLDKLLDAKKTEVESLTSETLNDIETSLKTLNDNETYMTDINNLRAITLKQAITAKKAELEKKKNELTAADEVVKAFVETKNFANAAAVRFALEDAAEAYKKLGDDYDGYDGYDEKVNELEGLHENLESIEELRKEKCDTLARAQELSGEFKKLQTAVQQYMADTYNDALTVTIEKINRRVKKLQKIEEEAKQIEGYQERFDKTADDIEALEKLVKDIGELTGWSEGNKASKQKLLNAVQAKLDSSREKAAAAAAAKKAEEEAAEAAKQAAAAAAAAAQKAKADQEAVEREEKIKAFPENFLRRMLRDGQLDDDMQKAYVVMSYVRDDREKWVKIEPKHMYEAFNARMHTAYDKSQVSGKVKPTTFEPNYVPKNLGEVTDALSRMLTYMDALFPVRVLINVRTGFGDTAKNDMADKTWKRLVPESHQQGGDFLNITVPGHKETSGPYYKVIKDGQGLEAPLQNDMNVLVEAGNAKDGKYKHYIYSAYGFSGSGKTTTLVYNATNSGTAPVLVQVLNYLKKGVKDNTWKVTLSVTDLYGEIYDADCQTAQTAKYLGKDIKDIKDNIKKTGKYEKIVRYDMNKLDMDVLKHEDLGKANDTGSVQIDMENLQIVGSNTKIDEMLEHLTGKLKPTKDFGPSEPNAISRYHVRRTPNNDKSSRAHCFIALTIKDKDGKVVGKVTLIDMAGSENVNVIQSDYFNTKTYNKLSMGKFTIEKANKNKAMRRYITGNDDDIAKEDLKNRATAKSKLLATCPIVDVQKGIKNLITAHLNPVKKGSYGAADFGKVGGNKGNYYDERYWTDFFTPLYVDLFDITKTDTETISDINVTNWHALLADYEKGPIRQHIQHVLRVPPTLVRHLRLLRMMVLLYFAWSNVHDSHPFETLSAENSKLCKTDIAISQIYGYAYKEAIFETDKANIMVSIKLCINSAIENIIKHYKNLSGEFDESRDSLQRIVRQYDTVKTDIYNDSEKKEWQKHLDTVMVDQDGIKRALSAAWTVDKDGKRVLGAGWEAFCKKIDESIAYWNELDKAKEDALFVIHCPIRFQGNYITQTLETDLVEFLKKLQCNRLQDITNNKNMGWVNAFLNAGQKEDVKFIQFINIRSDFTNEKKDGEDAKMTTYRGGAVASLATGEKFNMLDPTNTCKKL